LLRDHNDVILLADRGFANHDLISWLQANHWHYCLRLPSDVHLHGARRYPTTVASVYPQVGEAAFYRNVGLWQDGIYRCNVVVASPQTVKEPWAVISDQPPTLQTLWQYALRLRVEELFLDSKSGAFEFADSRLRSATALERLDLVAAVALLYATTQATAVQITRWRQQVDPHWRRGLSYLKIGLRWLNGLLHKGRKLLSLVPLLPSDPHPCFASNNAEQNYYDQILFSRIRSLSSQT